MENKVSLEDIVSLCKRRGFIYQGSEIYGGLAGTWDYGPLGVLLKQNIQNVWWEHFVLSRDDMYPLDAAILMNAKVWKASGHAENFSDPLVECSHCHSRFRQDHLESDKCPNCGKTDTFSKPRQFNMMLQTKLGAVESDSIETYLRPETAQGIFTNFKNVVDSFQPNIPFGIAQIGKAFRNEISPRDFIFRDREMEMMEIEYFFNPKEDWQNLFDYWLDKQKEFLSHIGINTDHVHQYEHPDKDRAHYSKKTIDWEYDYPFGRKELTGLAFRTDFDLSNHQKVSGKSMEYLTKDGSKPFLPYVIEPTFGVERLVLALLSSAYTSDKIEDETRTLLKLPEHIAPIKAAVFPLLKNKPDLVDKAKVVYRQLKTELGSVMWDDNGNIGKRYRRQDEIGTPRTITVDFQTLEDDTVTVRDRDTTLQHRHKISDLGKNIFD